MMSSADFKGDERPWQAIAQISVLISRVSSKYAAPQPADADIAAEKTKPAAAPMAVPVSTSVIESERSDARAVASTYGGHARLTHPPPMPTIARATQKQTNSHWSISVG